MRKQYIEVDRVEYEVFDSYEEAIEDGARWGVDNLPLTDELIELIKSGKAIKADNCEYVQIIYYGGEEK